MSRDVYGDAVWDHFARPRHAGAWPESAAGVGTGTARTPASPAVMRVQVRVEDGRVAAARFRAYGCVATIAAGSWVTERAIGLKVHEAMALGAGTIAEELHLAADKRHCALLAEDALHAALAPFTAAAGAADNGFETETSR